MRLLLPLCLFILFSSGDAAAQSSAPVPYYEVDVRPEPIEGFKAFSSSVEYPELARRAGIEGTVLAYFTVDEDGVVVSEPAEYGEDGQVTSRDREFPVCYEDPGGNTCETSLRAIRSARLTPASVGDERVPVQECFTFEYWLPEGKGSSSVPTRVRVSPCP